jgi:hypothetical protein
MFLSPRPPYQYGLCDSFLNRTGVGKQDHPNTNCGNTVAEWNKPIFDEQAGNIWRPGSGMVKNELVDSIWADTFDVKESTCSRIYRMNALLF